MSMQKNQGGFLANQWYRPSLTFLTFSLLPLSYLFRALVALRQFLYRNNFKKSFKFSVPVIVVGNITVGGTGKTPLVIELANDLRAQGYRPGIVSRGVGGKKQHIPYWVNAGSDVNEVGDEAVLLAKRTECPLVICIDRVAAVKELLAKTSCNIVLSDDGLQHYRLQRDVEITLIDTMRGLGNQQLLPSGPLREAVSRLKKVDYIMRERVLKADTLVSVKDETRKISLSEFKNKRVHAVAAIGNPTQFFNLLRENGFDIIEHSFKDHYFFTAEDLTFSDNLPVVMTEKDAVKCTKLAGDHWWYLPVTVQLDNHLLEIINEKITRSIRS